MGSANGSPCDRHSIVYQRNSFFDFPVPSVSVLTFFMNNVVPVRDIAAYKQSKKAGSTDE